MDKIWYIIVDGSTEGPFTQEELKTHPYVTPDTLCWKDAMEKWTPIRDVEELKDLFKEPDASAKEEEVEANGEVPNVDLALAIKKDPPFLILWLLLAAFVLIWVAIQLYIKST